MGPKHWLTSIKHDFITLCTLQKLPQMFLMIVSFEVDISRRNSKNHLSLPQYGSEVFCLIFLHDNNLLSGMSLRDDNSKLIWTTLLKPTFHQ